MTHKQEDSLDETMKESLRLLDKFFSETPKEEHNEMFDIYNNMVDGYEKQGKVNSGFFDLENTTHVCNHPSHNPPSHIVIPTGKCYRHVCPCCNKVTTLIPPQIQF